MIRNILIASSISIVCVIILIVFVRHLEHDYFTLKKEINSKPLLGVWTRAYHNNDSENSTQLFSLDLTQTSFKGETHFIMNVRYQDVNCAFMISTKIIGTRTSGNFLEFTNITPLYKRDNINQCDDKEITENYPLGIIANENTYGSYELEEGKMKFCLFTPANDEQAENEFCKIFE